MSEQPPQEWTPEYVRELRENAPFHAGSSESDGDMVIAAAYNAALASLEDKLDAQWSEGICKLKADHNAALAAERERVNLHIRAHEATSKQLAAEREKRREELQAEIHERDRGWSNYRESERQLAAEREHVKQLQALEATLQSNLAAERGRLDYLDSQLYEGNGVAFEGGDTVTVRLPDGTTATGSNVRSAIDAKAKEGK